MGCTTAAVPIQLDGDVTLDVLVSPDAIVTGTASSLPGIPDASFAVSHGSLELMDEVLAVHPSSGGDIILKAFQPISIQSLTISAELGHLVPGDSARPFEKIIESFESSWSVSSSSNVVLDGEVVLDVKASPDAQLSGIANDGNNSFRFHIVAVEVVPEPNANQTLFTAILFLPIRRKSIAKLMNSRSPAGSG